MTYNYCPSCGTQASVQKLDNTNYECTNCGWHFWDNSKACVGVVFMRDDGQILFAKRGREPHLGLYDLPGGFVDFDESAINAAIREAREELGVTIRADALELVATFPNLYDFPGMLTSCIDIIYLARIWEGEPRGMDDVESVTWQPISFLDSPEFCVDYSGLSQKLAVLSKTGGKQADE